MIDFCRVFLVRDTLLDRFMFFSCVVDADRLFEDIPHALGFFDDLSDALRFFKDVSSHDSIVGELDFRLPPLLTTFLFD